MSIETGMGNITGASPVQLDISATTPVVCECGNYTFVHSVFLREVSALVSPSGKAGIVPVPTFTCNSCGRVPDQVVPPFLKTEKQGTTAAIPAGSVTTTPSLSKGGLTLLTD